jgi:hypothetical protein
VAPVLGSKPEALVIQNQINFFKIIFLNLIAWRVEGIKRPRERGWLRVAEKPWSRFIVLVLFYIILIITM